MLAVTSSTIHDDSNFPNHFFSFRLAMPFVVSITSLAHVPHAIPAHSNAPNTIRVCRVRNGQQCDVIPSDTRATGIDCSRKLNHIACQRAATVPPPEKSRRSTASAHPYTSLRYRRGAPINWCAAKCWPAFARVRAQNAFDNANLCPCDVILNWVFPG